MTKEHLPPEECIILYVYRESCGYCKQFDGVFQEVAEEHGTQYLFLKSDQPYESVTHVPTVLFMKKGQEVQRKMGCMTKEEFTSMIAKVYNNVSEK